jgi:hypothetical protein
MGVYIYSVRTSSIETNIGTAYALGYLFKDHFDRSPVCEAMLSRAESVWEGREKPTLVYHAEKGNKPYVGSPVYKWNGIATCYDTPNYGGSLGLAGYLNSYKVGRKTCWRVEPVMFTVTVGVMVDKVFRVRTEPVCFSMGEAVAIAKRELRPGEEAHIRRSATEEYKETALERLTAASEEALRKVTGRLTTGPWPAHLLTADEVQAANELVASGKAVLYAEKYEGEGFVAWHGQINYKATVRLFDLKASSYNLRVDLEGDRIVFKGGAYGEHSLCRLVSNPERIKAHWQVYCENNGAQAL